MSLKSPFFRWYLSTGPYAEDAICTLSVNNNTDPLKCDRAELLEQLGNISRMYNNTYGHWFVMIDYTCGGDLATQRRHLHAEGLCPEEMPRFGGTGLDDRRGEIAAWAKGQVANEEYCRDLAVIEGAV